MTITRRSLLQSVKNIFSSESETDDGFFFGMQLLIHAFGTDDLRQRLAGVIADPDGAVEDTEAKRRYIKRVVAVLQEQQPFWSQAFWDYKTGRATAEAEFESWAAEVSAATATEGEELDDTHDLSQRLSTSKDYVAVTIMLLLNTPYPPAEIEDETKFWESRTIQNLIDGLLRINPETILADGIFVIPGNGEDGLSEQDLLTGGWSYLRVLT